MGWNQGYTIYEATIVAAYNSGKLDKELLAAIMEPYRGTDIDHGGETGLRTKDGKSADQVAVETFGLQWLPSGGRPGRREELRGFPQSVGPLRLVLKQRGDIYGGSDG